MTCSIDITKGANKYPHDIPEIFQGYTRMLEILQRYWKYCKNIGNISEILRMQEKIENIAGILERLQRYWEY